MLYFAYTDKIIDVISICLPSERCMKTLSAEAIFIITIRVY